MLMKMKGKQKDEIMNFINPLKGEDRTISIVLLVSFILVLIIVVLSNQFSMFFKDPGFLDFEEGTIANRDLIANYNFNYIDKKASADKIENELSSIVPVYKKNNEITLSVLNNFSFFTQMYLLDFENLDLVSGSSINLQSLDKFNQDEIKFLLESVDPYKIIPISSELLETFLGEGVFDIDDEVYSSSQNSIDFWQWDKGRKVYSTIDVKDIITIRDIDRIFDKNILSSKLTQSERKAVLLFLHKFLIANVIYDNVLTQLRYDKKRKEINPVLENIHSGDIIIRQGQLISSEDMYKINALKSKNKSINTIHIGAVFLLLLLIYLFSILIFKPLFVHKRRRTQYVFLLISFYVVFIIYISLILFFNFTRQFYLSIFIPTSLFGMMIVILIGFKESILSVVILSVSLFLFPGTSISDFLFSLISGVSAAFLLRDVHKRIDLLKPVVILSIINIFSIFIGLQKYPDKNWLFIVIILAASNAFISSIINFTLIPVFEHFLNIPTVFKLLELSNMDSPIFRKMATVAPGTYGHSIAVANLADAACRDIGANSLLARVGAYYHDIGKLDQAEYFIENQTEANKHDMLNSSLSVAVIKSHVKVGIEKAKEIGLPFEIIEIISQHHGSGLIGYFYIDAINKNGSKTKINPEDYSYTGIPPESKEAAVVMLADTVEAATRILKKPTILKLEKFIWKLILEKIERGQMSNTSLTMNDMRIISKSFVHTLSGYFHSRIEYPKIKTETKRKTL